MKIFLFKNNKRQKENKLPIHISVTNAVKKVFPTSEKFTSYLIMAMVFVAVVLLSNYLITETIATIAKNEGKNIPIYCVYTGEDKKVAISFDAAWGNEDTADLLEILDTYNAKATFFLVGEWIGKYPDDVKAILEAGHDIGNHSENHKQMSKLSEADIIYELMTAHDRIYELTGYEMDLFRPPFGDYNERLVDTARECDYYTIQWDVDSLDWKEYGTEQEINTVLNHKNLGNGSIILFHNDTKYTPQALPTILEGLIEDGYEIVPISELIIREDYRIDHEGRQFSLEEE